MNKRYESVSALLRYIGAVFAVVAFVFLFGKIFYNNSGYIKFADLFFNSNDFLTYPHVYGFVAQVLIFLCGVLGVLIPIIPGLTEKETKWSFIAGIILVVCGATVLCLKILYVAIEGTPDSWSYVHLYGTTIASGSLAVLAGVLNIWAAFIKE